MAKILYAVLALLALGQTSLGQSSSSSPPTPKSTSSYKSISASAKSTTGKDTSTTPEVSTLSEGDFLDSELPILKTCTFDRNEKQCNIYRSQLEVAIVINTEVCGFAMNYVDCLKKNCIADRVLLDSIQRVRHRCNGAGPLQVTGLMMLLLLAVHFLKR